MHVLHPRHPAELTFTEFTTVKPTLEPTRAKSTAMVSKQKASGRATSMSVHTLSSKFFPTQTETAPARSRRVSNGRKKAVDKDSDSSATPEEPVDAESAFEDEERR